MLIKLVEVIPQLFVFFWNLESFLIEILTLLHSFRRGHNISNINYDRISKLRIESRNMIHNQKLDLW